ncbi:MAG: hypothetical protein N2749_04125 [Clostridia bacterium]|nr:hypothetical protein [Clostridia bacterium]
METMRYRETKKSSKAVVIFITLFLILGCLVIYFAISTEKDPVIVGNNSSNMQSLIDVDSKATSLDIDAIKDIKYKVVDENINDSSNQKFKGNIILPKINIGDEELSDLNTEIKNKYNSLFTTLKSDVDKLDNKFTYKVSYNMYDNVIGNRRILSITIHDRVIDDKLQTSIWDKINTYNIDFSTKTLIKQSDIIVDKIGSDCKTKIKEKIKENVISKSMISEADYAYTYTGLENFYIKDGVFHIIFNEGDIVDKSHGTIDVVID